MNILGINFLSESTACIIKNGKLIFAISEERINRKKNWYGIPYKSINLARKLVSNKIDRVVTCGLSAIEKNMPNEIEFFNQINNVKKSNLKKNIKNKQINFLKQRRDHEDKVINERTLDVIKKLKKMFKNLTVYDHHTAHAATAAFYSKFKNVLCINY